MAKGRESGMPDKDYWGTFFNPPCMLAQLDCTLECRDVVEFGCGYGTFTIPAAQLIVGTLFALDIEPEMITETLHKAESFGLGNVQADCRDFMLNGSGLADASVDYAMLFNILHIENPVALLREACRVLSRGGRVGIVHWRCDIETPRGPTPAIRPTPQQCRAWGEEAGLEYVRDVTLNCCAWHWGMLMRRP